MKNQLSCQLAIALSITLGLLCSLNLAIFAPAADAACRPTGKFVGGRAVLKCSGATRCRPTGRYQTVRGVRYRLLRCPR
ncbi:hypothetical protein [Chamaesiphon sp.]|uniref:hypothetical protein n=1 Tax=Chamaesiphon sp. TaxID=2814140 RepID=UPI0035937E18